MKKKLLALVTVIGLTFASAAPANAWYGGWGGYGWGGYGAGLGVMAGAGFLGGLLGGAIAGGGYGYGGYGGWGGPAYGYGYTPGYTIYQPAPVYVTPRVYEYEGW